MVKSVIYTNDLCSFISIQILEEWTFLKSLLTHHSPIDSTPSFQEIAHWRSPHQLESNVRFISSKLTQTSDKNKCETHS